MQTLLTVAEFGKRLMCTNIQIQSANMQSLRYRVHKMWTLGSRVVRCVVFEVCERKKRRRRAAFVAALWQYGSHPLRAISSSEWSGCRGNVRPQYNVEDVFYISDVQLLNANVNSIVMRLKTIAEDLRLECSDVHILLTLHIHTNQPLCKFLFQNKTKQNVCHYRRLSPPLVCAQHLLTTALDLLDTTATPPPLVVPQRRGRWKVEDGRVNRTGNAVVCPCELTDASVSLNVAAN
ncbi:hypothetical protein F2P81_009004 [Scophthalmus maximus]|uniref:Uncharacterized protein n=1 Tax=Scophthalmus maximus TaxID=52904 RepID=A0A6A4T3C0_SCOMX|nr:hypothetical protein F2P81_009004 [Scophthalmus maximus]